MNSTANGMLPKGCLKSMAPDAIEFREMNEDEFSHYKGPQLEKYAQDIAKTFKRPIEEVRNEAQEQVNRILKNGLSTPDHFLYNVIEKNSGTTVGHVWFNLEKEKKRAFLYDIFIHESYRGKGYGRKTMRLLEAKLRDLGASQLGLHVFANNEVAINLYKTQGFYLASHNMQKDL